MDKLNQKVRQSPILVKSIQVANKGITGFIYLLYPLTLAYGAYNKDIRTFYLLLVPAISFVLLSEYRKRKNAPRPYEIYDYEPILSKETEGNSFPSRHVFSIFVISTGISLLYPMWSFILFPLGIILAMCRHFGGVHFLKDVVVGALCGVLPWLVIWALVLH